jgi:hypothetical protein
MEAIVSPRKEGVGFLDINHTAELKNKLSTKIITLDVDKATIEKIAGTLETSRRLLPKEARGNIGKTFLVKPDEEYEESRINQNKAIWDVGRILIFLSENKELNDAEYTNKAIQTLQNLNLEGNSSDYINYKNYLGWIISSDESKLKVLKEGKSARNAMLKMISPELDLLSIEEGKSLVIEGEQEIVMSTIVNGDVVNFSSKELSGRLIDLTIQKADAIKKKLPNSEIMIAENLKINVSRFSQGAGKCGDIENAIVEGVAKFIPINNGEMLLYFSSIDNIYMVTNKIIEGERGGIMLPNMIYSIPRSLLIKLSIADELPESIKAITDITLKPVREIATSTGAKDTLNQVYNKTTVINAFNSTLSQIRLNLI